jgi:hypothetical protein
VFETSNFSTPVSDKQPHSVQELAVPPRQFWSLAASLLLDACAAIDTERKDDPVFFGAAGGASCATLVLIECASLWKVDATEAAPEADLGLERLP